MHIYYICQQLQQFTALALITKQQELVFIYHFPGLWIAPLADYMGRLSLTPKEVSTMNREVLSVFQELTILQWIF